MLAMRIIIEGDNCWPDLLTIPHINAMGNDTKVEVACLPRGMASGKSSVAFRVEAPTGEILVFETSLALLTQAVQVFNAKYGE